MGPFSMVIFQYWTHMLRLRAYTMDRRVLRGIRAFCDRNGVLLISKLRHSAEVNRELSAACDLVVGEDSCYPNLAMDLYRIVDLIIGYHRSGFLESIAQGTSYLNVKIPKFRKELDWSGMLALCYLDPKTGVMKELSAHEMARTFPDRRLKDFRLDDLAKAGSKYATSVRWTETDRSGCGMR